MNAPEANRSLQLLAFGALAAFAAAQWVSLVADPPLAGALLVALASCGTAAALASLGAGMRRIGAWALAAVVAAAALGAGVLALGLSPGLLMPGGWSELGDGIGQGLNGLADADYPYSGQNPWVRRAILLALPLALALAAVLAFWPGRRRHAGGALVLLLCTYGVAVTVNPPAAPLLWGVVLLALVAAWLWLPAIERRALPAAAALAAAAVIGFGAGAALDGEEPWIDWTSWSWPGEEPHVDFRWNHTYGPIDWPREGTGLLRAESEEPHYWRTIALEHFDGFRWEVETERSNIYRPLEQPADVEGRSTSSLDPDWIERVTFTVGALDSGILVAPGNVLRVDGLDGIVPGSGATSLTAEPLNEGDEYTVTSYVPEPSASRLRSAPDGYPRSLRNYTRIELPRPLPGESSVFATRNLTVPLRGEWAPATPLRRLNNSIYGDVHALAQRLTAGAPTTYDAVTAIEQHLRRNYDYSETPPVREIPLRGFLFTDRTGYCQQFSGAMALMLRSLGIPSRVASGFSSGEREEGGGAFQVSDRDAHSWVEVYFNGIGWVAFEPTPAAAPAGAQLTELAGTRLSTPVGPNAVPRRGLVIPTVAGLVGREPEEDGGPWPAVLRATLVAAALALLVGVALAAAFVLRTVRTRRLGPAELAAAQARELERALPRMGFPIPEGSTLLELERRHAGRRAIARYVEALRACRYRPGRPVPGRRERAAMRRELSADRGLGGRLRALLAIPPGAPRS
jgi:transglutaminase-like putative cysteine protease